MACWKRIQELDLLPILRGESSYSLITSGYIRSAANIEFCETISVSQCIAQQSCGPLILVSVAFLDCGIPIGTHGFHAWASPNRTIQIPSSPPSNQIISNLANMSPRLRYFMKNPALILMMGSVVLLIGASYAFFENRADITSELANTAFLFLLAAVFVQSMRPTPQ